MPLLSMHSPLLAAPPPKESVCWFAMSAGASASNSTCASGAGARGRQRWQASLPAWLQSRPDRLSAEDGGRRLPQPTQHAQHTTPQPAPSAPKPAPPHIHEHRPHHLPPAPSPSRSPARHPP